MRKLILPLLLLLAAALIIFGAFLPQIAAAVTDHSMNDQIGSAPMQSVQLEFGGAEQPEPGQVMRKLALEQNMTTVPINASQTSMSEEEVYTAARKSMDCFIEGSIFQWFDVSFQMAEPYLGIDPDDPSNYMIFWGVTFVSKDEPYHSLFLHIDDETGNILCIKYETYGEDRFNYYHTENHRFMMEAFIQIFFSQLNLQEIYNYANWMEVGVEELDTTDEVTAIRYSFGDKVYGEVKVEFYIIPSGFYTYFPE